MIEINWNIFKAKFNGKESKVFEGLAYHLFCYEHNNNTGIFRFKNQTGIETEPIQTIEGWVGFQAKYYDTKIADNKGDIIDSIKKAKGKNPDLNKVLLYVNQELSESSTKVKKGPDYKTEIEREGKKIKLNIEWRVPSHFERQLALPENQYLAEFFFGDGNNIIDFIEGLKNHTESLLLSIQTDIVLNKQAIKIDRQEIINALGDALSQSKAIILSGEGGCGKTAVIKDFYTNHKDLIPFYVFKAVEFNIQDIKTLFNNYRDYSFQDFVKSHKEEQQKIVVIDSAERISDLEHQEPFKEFLSELLKNSWTIIFTTRLSYLDDLRFLFLSIYRLPFEQININRLTEKELEEISRQHSFKLPENSRMRNIIRNPFYLDEYLKNYGSYTHTVLYEKFKETIWLRKIQNSTFRKDNIHISREKCFLKIVKLRSENGTFNVTPTDCSDEILSLLLKDDIIGYDKNSGGYFITHDIYEEWGLNMLIEIAYNKRTGYVMFLNEIGVSLVVRRTFRQWLSDKLIDNIEDIKPFIEYTFENDGIATFWKDETLTSVLLSCYSEEFFIHFKEKILENDCAILKKIIFLLRIACKETDDILSKRSGIDQDTNLNYVITKPKGKGWNSTIHLIYDNKDSIPLLFLLHIAPLLSDWCSNNKIGSTTREAGLLALKLYTDIQTNSEYRHLSEITRQLIKIIIQSANEIKVELARLFDEVLAGRPLDTRRLYYELCKSVISSDMDNISIIIALPEYVLKLADLFWINSENTEEFYGVPGVERHYGLQKEYNHHSYSPASALQTPIYELLKSSFKKTVDFIVNFTNRTVKKYVDSGLDQSVQEIELTIEGEKTHKQYLSNSLWNMYRGSGSPAFSYLLQSMHMALEKHLLEIAEKEDAEIVESWLLYLIKASNSTSITSIVTSIVLAYPNKFFNVAKILFSCSDLFLYDYLRALLGENEAKSIYSEYSFENITKCFKEERLKTCEDKHRSLSLESLILNHQFLGYEHVSKEEAEKRQKEIWGIIDKFYSELPEKSKETDKDIKKRFMLARIDGRKMNPKVERQEDRLIIDFNPEIDDELKNYSEEVARPGNEMMKYSALKLWATYKFDNNSGKDSDYGQYENNSRLVLKETKEILDALNDDKNRNQYHCFNHSTPAYTCSALIREYSSELSDEEKRFCAKIILKYAKLPYQPNYQHKISDGAEVAINALPFLIELFPDEKDDFLTILLFILFNSNPIGYDKRVCDYSIESVLNNLWRISFEDAQKVLWGFLKFKPVFDSIVSQIKDKPIQSQVWPRHDQSEVIAKLIEKHGNDIENFMSTPVEIKDINLNKYTLQDLEIVFGLVPNDTNHEDLISLVYRISPVLAEELLKDDKNTDIRREIDYSLRLRVFKKFSCFILFRDTEDIKKYIQPFVDNFSVNKHMASLFHEFIFTENKVERYEQFWIIWESFYEKIKGSCLSESYHVSEVVHNYLLAWNYWKQTAKSWHSLKEKEKIFYKKVVKDIGHLSSVLDSIAKLLNEVGSEFLNEGIFWISDMIEKNNNNKIETNTVNYIEKLVRKYVYLNRNTVRKDKKIKDRILVILNFLIERSSANANLFLIERSSVNANLLREDIL